MHATTSFATAQSSVSPILIFMVFIAFAAIARNTRLLSHWRKERSRAQREAQTRINNVVREYPWITK